MGDILKDFQSGMPNVHGRTTINHEARVKLMLNCSEYVFMEWLHRETQKGKDPDTLECYVNTGFNEEQQQMLMKTLISKGMIMPSDDKTPTITTRWESAFANLDAEFEKFFWVKDGKVCWTGSKPKAKTLYINLRKKVSRELILKQRNTYFKYLECEEKLGFRRQKMMATVFLGPQERWDEDWETQLQECRKRIAAKDKEHEKRKDIKPVSKEEIDKMYGENNS